MSGSISSNPETACFLTVHCYIFAQKCYDFQFTRLEICCSSQLGTQIFFNEATVTLRVECSERWIKMCD